MKKRKLLKRIETLENENLLLKNKVAMFDGLIIEVSLSQPLSTCQSNKMRGPLFNFRSIEISENKATAVIGVLI